MGDASLQFYFGYEMPTVINEQIRNAGQMQDGIQAAFTMHFALRRGMTRHHN